MGRRGPPPKPQLLKWRQGTYRKDRDPNRGDSRGPAPVVPPETGAPPCPPELCGEARQLWDRLVPQLLELGTLQPQDGGALEAYCRMYVLAARLDQEAALRPIVNTPSGPIANPAGVEARKLWPLVVRLAKSLGVLYGPAIALPAGGA